MTDTPAWLSRYEGAWRRDDGYTDPTIDALFKEIQRLNDRIAVLESGQREMETRIPPNEGDV